MISTETACKSRRLHWMSSTASQVRYRSELLCVFVMEHRLACPLWNLFCASSSLGPAIIASIPWNQSTSDTLPELETTLATGFSIDILYCLWNKYAIDCSLNGGSCGMLVRALAVQMVSDAQKNIYVICYHDRWSVPWESIWGGMVNWFP